MTAMADAVKAGTAYKVVEITDVTDQAVEAVLNLWTSEGYRFESIHFATQPGSRRPAMAFLFFTLDAASGGE